jgi:hypothetical protein
VGSTSSGRPNKDDRNSEFLEYPHDLAAGMELKPTLFNVLHLVPTTAGQQRAIDSLRTDRWPAR